MTDFDSGLPVRTESPGDVEIHIVDSSGANIANVDADGNINVSVFNGSNEWDIDGNGAGLIVIQDAAGDALAINNDGSINVNVVDATVGDSICEFDTTVAGVPGTENVVIDYTVTGGKTLRLRAFQGSASGKFKVILKVGPTGSEVTKMVAFGSTAHGSIQHVFPEPCEVVAGDKVLVIVENRDTANADVYASFNGSEV